MAIVPGMLLAFLVGVLLHRYLLGAFAPTPVPLRSLSDVGPVLVSRSFFLLPLAPMACALFFFRRQVNFAPFRWGQWRTGERRWGALFLGWCGICLGVAVVMQAGVDFMPIRTERLWGLLPGLAVLALLNSVAEELLFRGFFFAAFSSALGLRWGLAAQAALFGLHHWGSSPDYVAALPISAFLVVLGYWWGQSVLGTRGLGWAVLAHMTLDLAFFSAQFVSTS